MKSPSDVNNPDEQEISAQEKKLNQEILEAILDLEKNPEKVEQISACIIKRSSHHAGPLPSPEIFKGYESVLPGAADRILSMAETQSSIVKNLNEYP